MSNALFAKITEDNWENHGEAAVNYADLKASIDDYYDENIAHRDHNDNSSSIPADYVPAGSSSNVPADYVSAGHVLVPADRDRIC
ncbi:hypothetical protein Tco_1257389 [Tanacetum coccineum]